MTQAWQTHDVTNQVPPLTDYNLYATDTALQAAVAAFGADWHAKELHRQGARLGEAEVQQWAETANRHTPELQTFDARGHRIDRVEFHPAWHALMSLLRGAQLQSMPWAHPRPGVMAARTASYFLHAQNEAGALCPTTMTFASIPVLAKEASLFPPLKDKLLAPQHDPRDAPLAQKHAMLVGMGMTEKQGGSDVRANTTTATERGDGSVSIVGHKWFFSAPQCDAHLVLARERDADAVSCFFVPRYTPDGRKNAVQIQRLKDKLGNRSNASSEVEFLDAYGTRVGAPGRGVPTIIEMATYTRLDCVIGSAAMMRTGVVQAIHHARHRAAFGAKLVDQDLMTTVLADLALESEAATWLAMRLARAFDAAASDDDSPVQRAWRRIVLPAAKFWVCKRALELAGECMEVWGGNGYVETGPLARLYREAPVNSIWEGSGNVMCLDVLRAMSREPEVAQAWFGWLVERAGAHAPLRAALAQLHGWLAADAATHAVRARAIAQQIVLLAQAALLLEHAPAELAHGFIESRFCVAGGRVYGVMPDTLAVGVQRAWLDRAFLA
ncbi:isovaleryl-CoA dehydrogenase [Pandoraea nosoerga]|uniref:DNA alkylation response protein n=1 Tax=Pandoraea nosoerga TaxID=2508296 RepID=A0A5E4S7C9_9BURK|nr:isovaleryl-CoA dehydrogenase [Pandoraea nosoerga]MBN4667402.1 isovaleryl-CoA dehydrogenase [Pandoraea nosoerga]MBN4677376.1 isovaleryl-CoA dehydrogenase [Pandoraea nosoerga]MBN4682234.1 isovaleryl-CoA dehydrogenase [Pandoraea nosoerga]VVD70993.1 DNA alkylation response protein [Pandoraea nosoerga]